MTATKKVSKTELKRMLSEQAMLNEDLSLDLQPFLRMLLEASEGIAAVAARTKNPWVGMLAKFITGVSNKANSAVEAYFQKNPVMESRTKERAPKKLNVQQLKEMVKSELQIVKEDRVAFFEHFLDFLEKLESTPRAPSEVRNSASVLKAYLDRGLVGRLEESKK